MSDAKETKCRPIKKLLAANRSEIATRIFRGATELGLNTVAIYAEEDRFCMHRFKADEAYKLRKEKGPVGAYLDIEGIIAIAKERNVDAIHPGYGFLSENSEFAKKCEENDIIFVGPRSEVLAGMGDKIAAREQAAELDVPTLAGNSSPIKDKEDALEIARNIGFPLIIKAAFGGGGRGMRVVNEEESLPTLLDEAQTEALNAFGDDSVFIERFVKNAKHIEVQIIGDQHGNVIHLHERDCSVQRRHQKVIEIAPSINIPDNIREELCDAAVKIAQSIKYDNAGTVEFLVDTDSQEWFFIEMNPRIQVEHTVTEEITNIDIVRSYDMLAIADAIATKTPSLFSLEMWGGATFDSSMRFLKEDPWQRLTQLREKVPNILFQMLFRGSNAVGYSNYPDNVVKGFVHHAAKRGMDVFRIFDSLNYTPNMIAAMEAVRETEGSICEAAICYTGDILDEKRDKYSLKYYVNLAHELKTMGAHILCIKDMAGLCRPYAAEKLVRTLKEEVGLPIHFHTHDTSGINASSILKASEAGVDIADAALSSMSGSTSQPCLNSIVAALENTERESSLDLRDLDEFSDYWEGIRKYYFPFDTSPPHGTAEVYLHEMPGGQFTNLKEQAEAMGLGSRWPEIAQCYSEVNDLFGDIVKVTPSSKVVGDMTMFLVTQGISPADVTNLPKGTAFPESVVDMLGGGLGQPIGGWPSEVQKVILGGKDPITDRPGDHANEVNLDEIREELKTKINRDPSEDEIWSYLMYPQVFLDFIASNNEFSDLSVLPTPAYFYGAQVGEEISIDIEVGKTLFVELINVGEPDDNANRNVIFELNGSSRHALVTDRTLTPTAVSRKKADKADLSQIGAPMPGLIAELNVSIGNKVEEGDPLLTLEAMKMYTTVSFPHSGTVESIEVSSGDNVDTGDLLLIIA